MKIAVISDIHGNVPALEAVVADIAAQQVDEVLVGGDLVGRGPQGSEVVQQIVAQGWPCIRGNHEDYLLQFRRHQIPDGWLEADEWSASRWMAAELTDTDVAYIDSLPFSITSQLEPRLRLVHGSPRSNNEGLGPWSSDKEIEKHFESVAEPVLVCAHTHRPLEHYFDKGMVINVGSVGLPFNGDRRAQYAIFHIDGPDLEVEFRQVDYDLDDTLAIYESTGFLEQGGVTARLLRMELENAQPFLVPFLYWAKTLDISPSASQIDEFRRVYDPEESIERFVCRLKGAATRSDAGDPYAG
jgi:predicted phosphodiesterase